MNVVKHCQKHRSQATGLNNEHDIYYMTFNSRGTYAAGCCPSYTVWHPYLIISTDKKKRKEEQ
jgi:hypothetical protein